MRVSITARGREEFMSLVRENGLTPLVQRFDSAGPVAAMETIQIIEAVGKVVGPGGIAGALAYAFGKWLEKDSKRKVIIQTEAGQIKNYNIEGYDQKSVEQILKAARSATAIDPGS